MHCCRLHSTQQLAPQSVALSACLCSVFDSQCLWWAPESGCDNSYNGQSGQLTFQNHLPFVATVNDMLNPKFQCKADAYWLLLLLLTAPKCTFDQATGASWLVS